MENTPKSMRLQIGIFGRTNVGKSSFMNMIAGQDIALTSEIPGTTTDVVEKSIELLPVGPVVLLDTAGIDDSTELGNQRLEKTKKIFSRADIAVILTEPGIWTDYEENLINEIVKNEIPFLIVINKIDNSDVQEEYLNLIRKKTRHIVQVSSLNWLHREQYLQDFKALLLNILPAGLSQSVPLLSDLMPSGGLAVFIVPIDLQAPKGRLILPQVQAIRDILDNDSAVVVVKDKEYPYFLSKLNQKPDLVVCDSQVVMKMVADTPNDVRCTTFSILFSRFKGDLLEEVKGVAAINNLHDGDKILIAEACSHHALEDDIGRVKIPRWLRQYLGSKIEIEHYAGRDFPENLSDYKVAIHCGGCMLTRNEKLMRIRRSNQQNVPITNYGLTISLIQGVIERVLSPFPLALETYRNNINP